MQLLKNEILSEVSERAWAVAVASGADHCASAQNHLQDVATECARDFGPWYFSTSACAPSMERSHKKTTPVWICDQETSK